MLGHEMSGTLERCAVDPARREPKRVELSAKDIAHLTNAGQIERTAIDVDEAFEQ